MYSSSLAFEDRNAYSVQPLACEDGNVRSTNVLSPDLPQQERLLKHSGTWDSEAQTSSLASSKWADSSSSDQRHPSMSISDTATSVSDVTAAQSVPRNQAALHAYNSSDLGIGIEGEGYFSEEPFTAGHIAMQSDCAEHNGTPFGEPWTVFARHTIDTTLDENHVTMATNYTNKREKLFRPSEQHDTRFRCSETGCTTSCNRKSDLVRHRRTKHPESWTSTDIKGYRCADLQCPHHAHVQLRIDKFMEHTKKMHPDRNMSLHIAASEFVLKTANGPSYDTALSYVPGPTANLALPGVGSRNVDEVASPKGAEDLEVAYDSSWAMSSWLDDTSILPDVPFSEITVAPEPRRLQRNLVPVLDQLGIALRVGNTESCPTEQQCIPTISSLAALGLVSAVTGAFLFSTKPLARAAASRSHSAPPEPLQNVPSDGDHDFNRDRNRTAILRGAAGIPGYGNWNGSPGGRSAHRGRASHNAPVPLVNKRARHRRKSRKYIFDCLLHHDEASGLPRPLDCRQARSTWLSRIQPHNERIDHKRFYCAHCVSKFNSQEERQAHTRLRTCRFKCVTEGCLWEGREPNVACNHHPRYGNTPYSIWKALFKIYYPNVFPIPEPEEVEADVSRSPSPAPSELNPVFALRSQAITPQMLAPSMDTEQRQNNMSRTSMRTDAERPRVNRDVHDTEALRRLAIDLWKHVNGIHPEPSRFVRTRYYLLMSPRIDSPNPRTQDDALLETLIEGLWEFASKPREQQHRELDLWDELRGEATRLLAEYFPEQFIGLDNGVTAAQSSHFEMPPSDFGVQSATLASINETSTNASFSTMQYWQPENSQPLSMDTQSTSDGMLNTGDFDDSLQSFDPFQEGNDRVDLTFQNHTLYQGLDQPQQPSQHQAPPPAEPAFENLQVPLSPPPQQFGANYITPLRLAGHGQFPSHLTSSTQTRNGMDSDLSNTGISAISSFTDASSFYGATFLSGRSRRSAEEYLETPLRSKRPRTYDLSSPQH